MKLEFAKLIDKDAVTKSPLCQTFTITFALLTKGLAYDPEKLVIELPEVV